MKCYGDRGRGLEPPKLSVGHTHILLIKLQPQTLKTGKTPTKVKIQYTNENYNASALCVKMHLELDNTKNLFHIFRK